MAAGFDIVAAIRKKVGLAFFDALMPFSCEKAFGDVVQNKTKSTFTASAARHVDDEFNVIVAVIRFVVANFHAFGVNIDVTVDVAVVLGVEVVVVESRNAYVRVAVEYLKVTWTRDTGLRHCCRWTVTAHLFRHLVVVRVRKENETGEGIQTPRDTGLPDFRRRQTLVSNPPTSTPDAHRKARRVRVYLDRPGRAGDRLTPFGCCILREVFCAF
ncbi:hypothetical protein D6C84_05051 [Aureobasidium pullulans]|uniref:Uncharacterized protein n=1 Tax=Aureobasidium pullulans TaxID=5580 RepID=A0A4S9XVG7_AURPU|nr:hypothetical protein D6C84_05051 [Aureobasidium pullulans]